MQCKLATPLARNTLWSLGGYGMRLVIQAAYFIIIARCLGPGQYGGFVAATALTGVISPFVGLGCGGLLIKNVARDRRLFREYWGNGLFITLVSGCGLTMLTMAVCRLALPRSIPMLAISLISISDLIFMKLLDMAAWAFQGVERLSGNARLNVLASLTRLAGIAGLSLTISRPGVLAWSAVYLVGSIVAGLIGVVWVTLSLGIPRLALHRMRGEGAEGFYFSVSQSAMTIYNDIDKTMVARLSTLEAAGIYAASYRLIDVSFIPVRALLNAAYPGFFRSGTGGLRASIAYGQRLLKKILPYSVLAFAALIIGAPLVPRILGSDYAHVIEALRWLALLPVLKTLHYFVADSLTGGGHQGLRTCVQVVVAVFNILVNLWIIPVYGWRGAAWSSLASDGLLFLGLWSAVVYLRYTSASDGVREIRCGTGVACSN
ncbi:MAG TPA: oligosaccharide flippase family protein [Terriglobia bacterium]|nr:oligosaccharide flippase family protein [Terriglobia bacterium]